MMDELLIVPDGGVTEDRNPQDPPPRQTAFIPIRVRGAYPSNHTTRLWTGDCLTITASNVTLRWNGDTLWIDLNGD
jgi:hypothetical protein